MYLGFDRKDYQKVHEVLKGFVSDDRFITYDTIDLGTDAYTINRAFTTLSHAKIKFSLKD